MLNGEVVTMEPMELLAAQREVAAALMADPTPDGLVQVGRRLARLLRDLQRDGEFWADGGPVDRTQLALVVAIDWHRVLTAVGYEPPPSVGLVAEEVVAAGRAAATTANWARLRELLGWLAGRLDADAADPGRPEDRSWWTGFRERIGLGVAALRRITVARLVRAVRDEVVEKSTSTVVLAVLGIPMGSVLPLVADLVGKIVAGAVSELEAAWLAEKECRQSSRLQAMVGGAAFDQAEVGRVGANIGLLRRVTGETGLTLLAKVGDWVAQAGAELAVAWGYLAAHAGADGARWTDAATLHIGELRWILLQLAEATQSNDEQVPTLVDMALAAVHGLNAALLELRRSMQATGLEAHHQ